MPFAFWRYATLKICNLAALPLIELLAESELSFATVAVSYPDIVDLLDSPYAQIAVSPREVCSIRFAKVGKKLTIFSDLRQW